MTPPAVEPVGVAAPPVVATAAEVAVTRLESELAAAPAFAATPVEIVPPIVPATPVVAAPPVMAAQPIMAPAPVAMTPAPAARPPAPTSQPATMVPWIATKQFTIDVFPSWAKTEGDKEWSLGAVTVDTNEFTSRLETLIQALNEDQWEVKFVVPLDKSLTYHEHQKVTRAGNRKEPEAVLGAVGLGWAASTTSTLIVVCQRTEWLEPSEYKGRLEARRQREASEARKRERAAAIEANAVINQRITASQKLLEELKAGIEAKKSGFLRGEKFMVAGVEYPTRGEAAAALAKRTAEVEADLVALPRQLKVVPPEM